MLGLASAALTSACCTAQPVASSTWTMRRCECPPSRVRCQRSPTVSPFGVERHAQRRQPLDRMRRRFDDELDGGAIGSAPRPRSSCRSIWLSNVSPASSTAAMPPCAQAVEPPVSAPLAMTSTRLMRSASVSAAVSPAAPEPMMMTSYLFDRTIMPPRRQIQEHVLQIRLTRRDIDDAEARRLHRVQHLARIGAALSVADGEGALAGLLAPCRSWDARAASATSLVDRHDHDLFLRHVDQLARRLVRDQLAVVDDGDAVAQFLGLFEIVRGEHDGDAAAFSSRT
jgi:hypothetical protein